MKRISVESYGVKHQNKIYNQNQSVIEVFKRKGYVILPSKMKSNEIKDIEKNFEKIKKDYIQKYVKNKNLDFSIRAIFSQHRCFLNLAQNANLINFLKKLFDGEFMLNQQNGLINSPNKKFAQARWHRDLPYQHFVSSKNISINAIYCIDEFTNENGCTQVLPYSQLFENFPSDKFVLNNYDNVKANAGDFIILNGMTYHKGGINKSSKDRRAINSVFSIPFIRHQIDLSVLDYKYKLTEEDKRFLGFQFASVKAFEDIL